MTALAIYNDFNQLQTAAAILAKSGYFQDTRQEAQAIVKVMAGAELGLPPFASMTGISIIKGKPVLGANLIATLISQNSRYSYRVTTNTPAAVVIAFYDGSENIGESSFTMDDAKAAGLTNKDNWRKYPRNMLFARAISNGARWYCPAIFGGSPVYTPDEFNRSVDEQGDIVEGEIIEAATLTVIEAPARQTDHVKSVGHDAQAPQLTDNEQMVHDTEAKLFVSLALRLLPYYKAPQHLKNAAKKCGYEGISGKPLDRVELFRCLKAHAEKREAEKNLTNLPSPEELNDALFGFSGSEAIESEKAKDPYTAHTVKFYTGE